MFVEFVSTKSGGQIFQERLLKMRSGIKANTIPTMRGYFITNYGQLLLSHMTSVEGEMGAQKFRFINSVEFLLIYIFGHRGGTKTICACCKGCCKGASRKVNKVYSNDASEFMIKVHQLLQNNGSDPTA